MAASASVANNPNFKIDRCSPLWRHVQMIRQMPGGGGYVWICSHCREEFSSSYSRVKAHLCFIPQKGTKFCTGKPRVNGVLPKTFLPNHIVNKYIQEQKQVEEVVGRASSSHPLESGRPLKKGKTSSMSLTTAPSEPPIEGHPFLRPPQQQIVSKRVAGPLESSFQNEARDNADQAIARCMYANGLSFNVVRSPYRQYMVRAINVAPNRFKGLGYEKVCTTLLDDEVACVENAILPIKDAWVETGVRVVSYGWKDARNCPLVNVLAVSTRGAMFLKAVDCEGEVKDGPFIANSLIQAIEQVGPQNVVKVITDNVKNCRAVSLLVEERYEHIFWTPCTVHSLNLMLKKIGTKVEWIKKMYEEAQEIQTFVTNHHMTQAIFRQFSKLELLKWDRVEYLLKITEPILSMIRYTDMDRPCLGEVYDGIDSMIEEIRNIINEKEQDLDEKNFKELQLIMIERWNKMTTPLHLLAFALSPRFYSQLVLKGSTTRVTPYRDPKVAQGYKAALQRLFPEHLRPTVRFEFMSFACTDDCGIEALEDKNNANAHKWWYFHGQKYQHL